MNQKMKLTIGICFVALGLSALIIWFIGMNSKSKIVVVEAPVAVSFQAEEMEGIAIVKDLNALKKMPVEIVYHVGTNIPKKISGKLTNTKVENIKTALLVVLELQNIYGITEYEFACELVDERKEYMVYDFKQMHKGIVVDGGYFRVVTSKEGDVISVEGSYKEVLNAEIVPRITYEEGCKRVTIKKTAKVMSAELVIWALTDEEAVLCWKYITEDRDPVNNKVTYVNAVDGTVVWETGTVFSGR